MPHVERTVRAGITGNIYSSAYGRTEDFTYASFMDLYEHYRTWHEYSAVLVRSTLDYAFCSDRLPKKPRERFQHVGHHMEEFAFAVVPRQYENWEFYIDSERESGSIPLLQSPNLSEAWANLGKRYCYLTKSCGR